MRKSQVFIGTIVWLFSVTILAEEFHLETIAQDQIRPSYPFPEFLSTGPYVYYKDAENTHIKGHTYRIATFTEEGIYRVYLEKVIFGVDGCCLEIVDYRELRLNEEILKTLFPDNEGKYTFKLVKWNGSHSFVFKAYGGIYQLSEIQSDTPLITEVEITNDE